VGRKRGRGEGMIGEREAASKVGQGCGCEQFCGNVKERTGYVLNPHLFRGYRANFRARIHGTPGLLEGVGKGNFVRGTIG
jgi:hypothetical protein